LVLRRSVSEAEAARESEERRCGCGSGSALLLLLLSLSVAAAASFIRSLSLSRTRSLVGSFLEQWTPQLMPHPRRQTRDTGVTYVHRISLRRSAPWRSFRPTTRPSSRVRCATRASSRSSSPSSPSPLPRLRPIQPSRSLHLLLSRLLLPSSKEARSASRSASRSRCQCKQRRACRLHSLTPCRSRSRSYHPPTRLLLLLLAALLQRSQDSLKSRQCRGMAR